MAKPCIVKYKGNEYSVEQFSAMLHDGLLNNLIESGAIDQNKLKGDLKLIKADTGEVSFRFEKSGTATVKNAPKGTYLNIGLLKGETEELISIDDVLSNLPSDVKVIKQRQVTGTEPTLALQINRKMSDQEMEDFRNATAQMAIPQLSDGKGVIHGTQEWGEFNPEYFVLPNNKPLSSIKGVEITSVEPNEEEPSFRKDYEVIDLSKIKSKQELIDKLEGKYLIFDIQYVFYEEYKERIRNELNDDYTTVTKYEEKGITFVEGRKVITRKDIEKIYDTIINDALYGYFAQVRDLTPIEKIYRTRKVKTATAKEVLTVIANDKESKYSELAKELLRIGNSKGLSVPIKMSGKMPKAHKVAYYDGNLDSIFVNSDFLEPFKQSELEQIIIHEVIHGFSAIEFGKYDLLDKYTSFEHQYNIYHLPIKGYKYQENLNDYVKDKKSDPHIKNLVKAYLHAIEKSGLNNEVFSNDNVYKKIKGVPYGFTNLDEFLTETFSNPEFQNMLNEIEMPGTKKTIWQTIVDAIRNILGLSVKQGSVLESALRNGAEIINKARGGVETEEGPSFRKISGQDVANEAVEMGSDQGGISDFLANNIAKEDYTVETVSIDDLRKTDPYLDEYLNSGEVREFEGEAFAMRPIVSSIGEVLDGYNRIAQMVENGETEVEVYKGQPGEVSFRLTDDSGVSYEDTIKMAGWKSKEAMQEWQDKNFDNQRQKRNPEVQKAAQAYKRGDITQYEMIQAVRENQPIKSFVTVPKIPSFKEIVASIKENQIKTGVLGLTKEVPNGTLVGLRLDIPAYDYYDTWVVSVHDGANRTNKGANIAYAQTAVITNVTFGAEPTAALNIATGKSNKTTVARMYGEWVNEDPQSVHDRVEKLMNDPAWTQVGMNPFRHSWFYDKANGNPVISADEVIQVGALVLAKNVVMGSITDQQFKTKNEKGEEIYFRKDDKVKGTYFEPAMTTDSKGNYVFFHFSTAPLKSLMKGIDSRKYYSTRTSREEKGLQYGVASYYTKPTDSENVVGGDKYYVTVSPDKVYPMDLDPNGYRAAAEKKIKKNTPFRESRISKEIANAAARDGYEMAVGEWSYDRAGLTQSETPEFRGDALVPLKPTELTGKEKFKTGKERGIKTEHPDKARLAFNQQVEDLASDIDSYKSSKGKFDDAYEIASTVMVYGGIVEDYGTKDERVRPLTIEEFDTMTKGLSPKLKQRAEKLREQMDENEELSMRIDDLWHGTPHKVGKFSTKFMGTGEGAQMFGWGLYFTNLKSIAKGYAKALGKIRFKGESLDENPIFDKLLVSLDASHDEFYDYSTGAITNLKKFKEYIDDMYQYLKRESNKVIDEYNPRVESFLGEWGGTNYDASILKKKSVLTDEQEKEFEKKVYEIYEANGLSKEEADRTLEMRVQSRKAALKSIYQAMKLKATRAERVKNAINFVKNDLKSDLNYYKFLSDNFDKFDLQRNLYKVSLHEGKTPDQYTYLDWYKKPNKQQVENLFSKLTQKQLDKGFYYGLNPDATNADLYKGLSKALGGDKQASLFLLENGIDGIKFPAESISRGATDETARGFNYVVFDENAITIEEEISFRADMGQRRITSNPRLMAMLRGANFKDLRNVINLSPDSFYTPQKYAQLKPQIASMSDAELLAAIDVETSLEDIFNNTDGPIIGLAFIEYINRLKNIVEDPNSTQNDIDNANELIQKAYESVAPFTTKVAQVLRQLGEIKSTIKKDEVQFYLDMIEALIEANGNMINDEHREALKGVIEVLLNSKKEHAAIFEDLANKGNNVTDQDIVDLNVAEVEMQNAHAALNMLVGFLSPPSSQDFWSGVMRGNLMSIRSALTGLYSNLLNIGVFRFRNLVQATLSIPFAILKKAGINTFGLEKYQLFNTPIVSNIKYGLFLDVIQDALVGVAKAIATLSKMMIGKESFRGFLDKSPTANRVFNIIKYGSSGIEGGSPVILDKSNHTMTAIRKAMTPKGGKTRLNIRGMRMDVASSFKKIEFSKWFKANYPGSDYSSLSAKDKKIIQNEYFNDPKAMVPTFGGKVAGLGRAIMAVNSEFVFRLVALSDYLPKTYANNVEMTRLAQSLGLDEKQTILFMRDPARYIEIMSNVLSPEALNFWIDTVNEVTVTKDTGLGKASTAFVEALKNYVPKKLMDKFPALKDNKWFKSFVGLWQFGIDSVVPFVKIPMNAISLTADFLIPSKPLIKAIYFSGLALNNKGTDQAEAYALSAMKNYSMAVVALGIRSLAVGLVSIPGMVVLAPGKDDDDEKKKMKSKFSRMSININALRRYFSGEDPSYKEGDKYESLIAYGILGMVIYNYASISETSNKEYYDQLSKAPKNLNPKDVVTGSPFDIANSGALELELKAFQSSQFFIDQSWFVGLNSTLEGLTGGDTGRDKFVNNYIGTLLSLWWGFSSHAQQVSDIYREATGKPVFDVTLPTELQGLNKQGYPGILGDRVWNNIFKKNELIHKALMKTPEESEYVKFSMYGDPMSPVPGNTKNNLEIVLSVAAPARRVTPNLTKEERLYMAVYDNKNKINIPGYSVSLTEPTLNKVEKIKVFMPEGEEAESISVMIMPKEYNKINKMAGDALRDLHTVLLSEQGLLDYEVRGKVISPEDIMSKNWGNTREVANVRNSIAVAFSEGNKLLNTFLKPWELFGDDITKYIGRDKSATIQDAYSLIDSKISTYKVLNPETGKMELLENYLVGHPELSDKLYNLAKESISVYLKAAEEAVKNNEEWNKLMDNPEMTIEQEKARKEGNF